MHELAGEFDAASAGALAGAHLLGALPHEVIARFDVDSLVDYRAHRPRVTFHGDRYESFAAPELLLYALEDDAGEPFLLLHGVEPDFAWERFVAAVGWLVERLGVTSVVSLQAIPMPVPHTRPPCSSRTPYVSTGWFIRSTVTVNGPIGKVPGCRP